MSQIPAKDWSRLAANAGPFLQHQFLNALETSGAVTRETGWQPFHLCVHSDDLLVGAMPLYIKEHSYGEYVFDFAWANAYQQHGLDYYPKLLNAIPFTPVSGPRWLLHEDHRQTLLPLMLDAINQQLESLSLSSFHSLFMPDDDHQQLTSLGCIPRLSVQFQWYNRDYVDWQHYLDQMTARRRKSIRKERDKVGQQDVSVKRVYGQQISTDDMAFFYQCYRKTYLKRSGHEGYLTPAFFTTLHDCMADNLLLVIAEHDQQPIAAALYLFDAHQLNGRYWGALQEVDGLHFECCYYQGIEFCIEQQIEVFNPGTQGEHKILRGFEPTLCFSGHQLVQPAFHQAVARAMRQERDEMLAYKDSADTLLPFKTARD